MAENNRIEIPTGLYWQGKKTEVERVSLPFQTIETVNESRATREREKGSFLREKGEGYGGGWYNRLIWGENKYALASLLDKFAGGINLVYIDPPFATGTDFSINISIGDVEWTKEASAIEEKAYRDTWGKGLDSYLQMIYERLVLVRDLLTDDGAIYVHLDWHIGHYVKIIMDEIFGKENFRNEINCKRIRKNVQEYASAKRLNVALDTILFYAKSDQHRIIQPRSEISLGERWHAFDAPDLRTGMDYELLGVKPPSGRHWMWDKEKAMAAVREGTIRRNQNSGRPEYKVISENPILSALWDDIPAYSFQYGFDTEKSEKLLIRIIEQSSSEGQIVADIFSGSGTTGAVAEQLGRKWIMCDIGRFAIQTSRKRLLDIEGCKPFVVQNLGKYERQYWQGVTFGKRKSEQVPLYEYIEFVLKLYRAEPISGFEWVHGKKGKRLIHVGAVDAPVTLSDIQACIAEVKRMKQEALDILGWEWEMGLHDVVQNLAKESGVSLSLRTIPRDAMDPRAVEAGDVQFFELAHLEVEVKKNTHAEFVVALKDFAIQNLDLIPEEVSSKIKKWSDYIDYWAVDWDYDDDTFHNQWQSYRTRKDRALLLKSDPHSYETKGKHKVLIKVIDIFGNDTTHLEMVTA